MVLRKIFSCKKFTQPSQVAKAIQLKKCKKCHFPIESSLCSWGLKKMSDTLVIMPILPTIFIKRSWRTKVLFVGQLVLLFWTLGNICPGFQGQGGSFFVCAFLPVWSLDLPLMWHLLIVQRSAWQPSLFDPFYLQTCPQALVELWARARTHDCLCSEHSTAHHSATPDEHIAYNLQHSYFSYCVLDFFN